MPAEYDTPLFRAAARLSTAVRDASELAGIGRKSPAELLAPGQPLTLASVADGAEGLVVADLARAVAARPNAPATSLAGDLPRRPAHGGAGARARVLRARHRGAGVPGLGLPALRPRVAACRHRGAAHDRAVAAGAASRAASGPSVLLTTVNAVLQRVPPRDAGGARSRCRPRPATCSAWTASTRWLELNGFIRASTVREPGDYAVRGGIVDLFPPGMDEPVRLDFFGDTLEIDPQLRSRDPAHRRSVARARSRAGGRIPAHHRDHPALPHRLCRGVRRAPSPTIMLYEAVSEGRRHPGMEHWLPLFHDRLDTLFDYLPGSPVVLEPLAEDAARERLDADRRLLRGAHARRSTQRGVGPALPAAAARPALSQPKPSGSSGSRRRRLARLTPFAVPESRDRRSISARGRAATSPPSAPSRGAMCSTR